MTKIRVIMIDDSGWGFPLRGVLIGAFDSKTKEFIVEEVPVKYFQTPEFERKGYLSAASEMSMKIINRIGAIPDNTLVKLCRGYINNRTEEVLKESGFIVERCEIGEPLQSFLEKAHLEYINRTYDSLLYYDPKGFSPYDIGRHYNVVIEFTKKNNAWRDAKTGWRSLKRIMPKS